VNLHDYYEGFWKGGGYDSVKVDLSPYQVESINKIFDSHGKKVLDLGCGDGRIGAAFLKDHDIYGIDFSEKAVEEARKKGIKAQVGDVASGLPYGDGEFDIVLITHMLEHVFDPLGLLVEAKRVLKPGGSMLCFLPNGANFLNRLLFLFSGDFIDYTGRMNILNPAFPFTGHIRIISPSLMKKMLTYLNMKVTRKDYWFPLAFETSPFHKFNWLAKCVHYFKLHKLLPNLVSTMFFCECQK
jgi:ubiquinone/menaquinone biosynthesis C-methylase UbiE